MCAHRYWLELGPEVSTMIDSKKCIHMLPIVRPASKLSCGKQLLNKPESFHLFALMILMYRYNAFVRQMLRLLSFSSHAQSRTSTSFIIINFSNSTNFVKARR